MSLAAIIAGSVTGIIVKGHHDDFENAENQSLYCDNPDNYCSNSLSHLSTASFITAGVAAAAGAVYYFVFARHGAASARQAAVTAASR